MLPGFTDGGTAIDDRSPLSFLLHGQTITALVLSAELLFILYFFFVLKLNFRFRSWGRSERRGHVERNVKCFRTGVSRSVCCRISLAYTMWERSPCLTFTPFFNLNCHNDRKDEDSLSLRVQWLLKKLRSRLLVQIWDTIHHLRPSCRASNVELPIKFSPRQAFQLHDLFHLSQHLLLLATKQDMTAPRVLVYWTSLLD